MRFVELKKKYSTDRILVVIALCASLVTCGVFLIHSAAAAGAVRKGIYLCGLSVIPSLFPMMFISQYFVKSGAAEIAGGLLDRPVGFLFGLPGVCGAALLTAFIGGYPAGARAAETLVEDGIISKKDGERLADMAFCAGPGFAIGMIGGEIYNNKSIGLLILTAQAFSCIIIGIIQRVFFSGDYKFQKNKKYLNQAISHKADAFVQSASDTASTLINMCSFIILFQVIIALLDSTGINALLGKITGYVGLGKVGNIFFPCTVEVTAGSLISVGAGLPFTAFVAGFGGLSVHFQNFAICRIIRLKKSIYFITRILQGGLCSVIVTLALKLPYFSSLALPASVNASGTAQVGFSRISTGFGCAMLVMCLMSVICLPTKKELTTS